MIKLIYKLTRESEVQNSEYDLSEFQEIEITLEGDKGYSIAFVNDKIVVQNNALLVDVDQQIESNLVKYE